MRALELGEFLRSRRLRLDPSEAGFPPNVRRRSPGLRREELSSMAGVTVSWLAKLEQGRAHSVSPEVLGALGRAPHLDDVETDHLFALAGLRADSRRRPGFVVTPALRVLLDELDPNPAYLLDRTWNIVAWNRAEAALFPGLTAYPSPPNLLELVFRDEELARLMIDHDAERVRLVSQFRLHRADWPGDPVLEELVARLQATSEEFARVGRRETSPLSSRRGACSPIHSPAGSSSTITGWPCSTSPASSWSPTQPSPEPTAPSGSGGRPPGLDTNQPPDDRAA